MSFGITNAKAKKENIQVDNNLIIFSTDYSQYGLTIKETNGVITIKGTASQVVDKYISFKDAINVNGTYKCALETENPFTFDYMAIYFANNSNSNVVDFDGGNPDLEKTKTLSSNVISKLHLYILGGHYIDIEFKPVLELVS